MTRQSTFRKHWTLNGVRYFRNNVGFYECELGVFSDYQKLLDAVLNHNEELIKEKSKTMTRIRSILTAPQFFKWDNKFIKVCEDTFIEVSSFGLEYENGTFNKQAYSINSYAISSLHNFVHEFVTELTKAEFAIELNKAYANISGFKHIEELWKDEEADTHKTEEIDLLSQCEIFIAGVQSYLGDDTTGKELLEKIKNYKK